MDLVYARCAAIDVHKRTAVVSVGWGDEQGRRQKRTRTFATMTADLVRLRQWLVEEGVDRRGQGAVSECPASVFLGGPLPGLAR